MSGVTQSTDMFTGSTDIVGQLGTTYNNSYTDKSYAHIDTNGNPGYLSAPPVDGYLERG